MTVRDIQSHIEEIYGGEISAQTISNITDRVLPYVEEWRNRQLQEVYAITYIDGIGYKVRSNGTVKDKIWNDRNRPRRQQGCARSMDSRD